MTCLEAGQAWYLDGFSQAPIRDVFLRDIQIDVVNKPIIQKFVATFSQAEVAVGFQQGRTVVDVEKDEAVTTSDDDEQSKGAFNLAEVRMQINDYLGSLLVEGAPYGCYRFKRGEEPSFYATTDVAIMRGIMGEDLLSTLTKKTTSGVGQLY